MKIMANVLVSYNIHKPDAKLVCCNYTEEKPEEGNANSDGLSGGAIFGIVLACIAGLLVLILIIVAIVFGLRRQRNNDKTDG